jgi:hypothetical protein
VEGRTDIGPLECAAFYSLKVADRDGQRIVGRWPVTVCNDGDADDELDRRNDVEQSGMECVPCSLVASSYPTHLNGLNAVADYVLWFAVAFMIVLAVDYVLASRQRAKQ